LNDEQIEITNALKRALNIKDQMGYFTFVFTESNKKIIENTAPARQHSGFHMVPNLFFFLITISNSLSSNLAYLKK